MYELLVINITLIVFQFSVSLVSCLSVLCSRYSKFSTLTKYGIMSLAQLMLRFLFIHYVVYLLVFCSCYCEIKGSQCRYKGSRMWFSCYCLLSLQPMSTWVVGI